MAKNNEGKTLVISESEKYTQALDYDGSDNLIYAGKALIGTGKADARWQIMKLTYSGTNLTDVQWSDGDKKFNNVWDDRVSLSYS